MSPAELVAELEQARAGTLQLIEPLADEQRARSPGAERWSVLQVVDHLQLSDNGIARVLARLARSGSGEPPADVALAYDFDREAAKILAKATFSSLEPRDDPPQSVVGEAAVVRDELMSAARAAAEVDCGERTFAHPVFGKLTAWEWMAFAAAHERSHHGQIAAIIADLKP